MKEGKQPYVGVGSGVRGGNSGSQPGGGASFDPAGGGPNFFVRGGIEGGTQPKKFSNFREGSKFCQPPLADCYFSPEARVGG